MGDNNQDLKESVASENRESVKSGDQKFDFITETIKKKPINKKRVFGKIIFTFCLAVMFGVVACLTFVVALPHIKEKLFPEETKMVTLSNEEETEPAGVTAPDKELPEEEPKEDTTEKSEPVQEKPTEVVTQVVQKVEKVEKKLDVSDYKHLYTQMSNVAYEVRKSLVTVTGVFSDTDWFMNPYEENKATSGVIVADNGKEMLIVAQTKTITYAHSIRVTFCDGSVHEAVIKKSDVNTGLSVIGVDINDLSEETKKKITMAKLGSSMLSTLVGSPVMALGNPIGVSGSQTSGTITSSSFVKTMTDTSVTYLTTDMYGSPSASGVLVNLDGDVIGIIYQDDSVGDIPDVIKAYGISDLKGKIEKLSNGQDLAILGIYGTDVTAAAAEELGIPFGAYVKEVVIDSPAMEAGIQSGDVIIKLGTTEIGSFEDFKDAMLKCQPGDLMMVTVMRQGRLDYGEVSYEITLGTLK